MTFDEYYKSIGFKKYPFSTYSTENEVEYFEKIFFPPDNYEPVKETFENGNTIFIIGNRGIGKTALIEDFKKIQKKNNSLFCFVDDFSTLSEGYSENEFIQFLLKNISKNLFTDLIDHNKKIKKLKNDQRYLLSVLYYNFFPVVNKRFLIEKINHITIGKFKTFLVNQGKRIRFIFNFGLNIGTNLYNDRPILI